MVRKKKLLSLILVAIAVASLVYAESSYNFLTKGFADTLYCPIDGSCFDTSFINVSQLNITFPAGRGGVSPWLYNDSSFMYFNASYLNVSVYDIIAGLDIRNGTDGINGTDGADGVDGINGTNGVDGLNGTDGLNLTMLNIVDNGDGTYTWNFSDGTIFTTANLTGAQGVQGVQGIQGVPGINGTDGLNGTNGINGTDGVDGFGKAGAAPWLYNDTLFWYFNESYFNISVINVASIYDDTTRIDLVNTTINIEGLGFVTGNHTVDTHIEGDNNYLYDNFTNMFFNESKLNQTVTALLANTTLNGTNIDGYPWWVNVDTIDDSDAYFFWNGSNSTLELWVNGELQQDWGASTTIYQEATFLDNIFGDGSTLLNVCLPNGSTVNGDDCNATSIFNVDEIWINNINGNATFNASKLNETIQSFIDNVDTKAGAQPWLYNDSDFIYFNESLLNITVQDQAEVKKYEESIIVTTSGGVGGGVSSSLIDFQITRITVVPDTTPSKFRFQAYEQGSLEIIDKDRISHTSLWDIEKSHAIDNEYVVVNITSAVPDRTFNVTLTFLDNFRP